MVSEPGARDIWDYKVLLSKIRRSLRFIQSQFVFKSFVCDTAAVDLMSRSDCMSTKGNKGLTR